MDTINYEKIIQKVSQIPYVHKILISDLNGNMLASNGTISDDEAAMSAILYHNALQVGKELFLSDLETISFLYGPYRVIVMAKKNILIFCVVDKKAPIVRLIADMEY